MPTVAVIVALRNWMDVSVRRSMQASLLYAKRSGLSMAQVGAMFQIERGIGSVSDLGEELGVTSAAASQMLDRMVQMGLILRREDPQDRRVKRLELTDKGRKVLHDFSLARQRWLADLVQALSDDEKERIAEALNLLVGRVQQLDASPNSIPSRNPELEH